MADRKSTYVQHGELYYGFMPCSEVCMHMRIAGRCMMFEIVGQDHPMVQLHRADGSHFSFPITTGEAGVYRDAQGLYFHPPETYGTDVDEVKFGKALQVLELTDDHQYPLALVAMAVRQDWTFTYDAAGKEWVIVQPNGRRITASSQYKLLDYMRGYLDSNGETASLFDA